jgi:LuxR family maltose regulon positive regulatory protein
VLVEPLSKREHDVLSLVAQGLTNEQAARVLKLGLETVKWHLKNVYGKLGVSRRTLAVHRARQLDLIGDVRTPE